jgi:hypothetical protein
MKKRGTALAAKAIVCLVFSLVPFFSLAQEGHPMSGSWVGDWGTGTTNRNRVVVILEWTGSEITGVVNPGPNAIPIKSANVDPTAWRLHFEAEGKDAKGSMVSYTVDGAIDDLGTYNRTLAGSWNVGNTKGDFSITRQ